MSPCFVLFFLHFFPPPFCKNKTLDTSRRSPNQSLVAGAKNLHVDPARVHALGQQPVPDVPHEPEGPADVVAGGGVREE